MAISKHDIKLLESQRMADTPDGGGRMTGVVLQSGADNNVFDDVASLDRVYGSVSLRKLFAAVLTNDVDKYLGARIYIDQPPLDANVQTLLFSPSRPFDTRSEAAVKVESYLAPGPFYQGLLYGNHLAGMSTVMLIQLQDRALPSIGQVLMLRKNEGLMTEVDQYARITAVSSSVLVFTDTGGEFNRRVVTCTISDALRADFPGFQAIRIDSDMSYAGKTRVFETVVADASQYFGIRPLQDAISAGAFSIKADTVFSPLLPSAQVETPIPDARSNNVSAAMVATGDYLTQNLTAAFSPSQRLFVGAGILPGSLTVVAGSITLLDAAAKLYHGDTDVGAVDYENGILSLSVDLFGSGVSVFSIAVTYAPAARPDFVSRSVGLPVSVNNRSLSWVLTLDSVPAIGSLSVSYLANGRWYVLRDDGTGALRGSDTSLGAGNLNYSTGTMVVTLGALPDVGSAVVLQWAEQILTPPLNAATLLNNGKAYFAFNTDGNATEEPGSKMLGPGTVSVAWNDGAAKTATDNGLGQLTGDATGTVDYVKGIVRISPNALPPLGTVFSLSNSSATVSPSAGAVNLFGGSAGAGIKPFSVSLPVAITVQHTASGGTVAGSSVQKTVQAVDDGSGNIVFGDGPNGTVVIGTVDYTSGSISLNSTVTLGAIDFEGATVTHSTAYTYTHYVYSVAG